MKSFLNKLREFARDDIAATAVEYAVVLMLIAGMCITAIQLLGGPVAAYFQHSQDEFANAVNDGDSP